MGDFPEIPGLQCAGFLARRLYDQGKGRDQGVEVPPCDLDLTCNALSTLHSLEACIDAHEKHEEDSPTREEVAKAAATVVAHGVPFPPELFARTVSVLMTPRPARRPRLSKRSKDSRAWNAAAILALVREGGAAIFGPEADTADNAKRLVAETLMLSISGLEKITARFDENLRQEAQKYGLSCDPDQLPVARMHRFAETVFREWAPSKPLGIPSREVVLHIVLRQLDTQAQDPAQVSALREWFVESVGLAK